MGNEKEHIDHIISGCKRKDRRAQEQLYRNFYRVMMSLCLRYTKSETDALEVLNTGFYKIYTHIGKYDETRSTVYTWIRTIIINTCLDFIKAKTGQVIREELDQAAMVHMPPDVFQKMSAQEILELVRQLPAATQAVFNLYVMEGYNHKEIGQLMNISDGTSKWHLSEARKTLKQKITKMNIGS